MKQKFASLFLVSAAMLLCLNHPCTAENSTELYNKGRESFRAGNMADAESYFKQSVAANQYYCLAHYGLGRVYLSSRGKINDSIIHLKKSVHLDQSFGKGYFYLGMAQLFSGDHIGALHSFEKAYSTDSTLTESLYNMGVIHEYLLKDYRAFTYYRAYFKAIGKKKETEF